MKLTYTEPHCSAPPCTNYGHELVYSDGQVWWECKGCNYRSPDPWPSRAPSLGAYKDWSYETRV